MSNSDHYPDSFPEQSQENQPGDEHAMDPPPVYIRDGYRGSGKLAGRKALITGGDSGIGRAVAVHFAREGADCAIIYLDEDRDARKTRELVENEGQKCHLIAGDLTDQSVREKAVEEARSSLGGLDLLVNNAAQQYPTDELTDLTLEKLQRTFDVNIIAMIALTKLVLEDFPDDGSIINTTSVTSYRGSEHLVDYASTKGAITSFTRSLAKNLAERGIRVNGVAPGPVWTPLIPASFDDVSDFGQKVPMGRAGQPAEVAPAYVYLACDDASYVTGQIIHVNGGEVIGS